MGKLIDKEQTYQTLSEYYHHTSTLHHMALREALDRVPVVDAVPVIRCKDCKHWTVTCDDDYQSCECDALIRHKDFYCARAERKE